MKLAKKLLLIKIFISSICNFGVHHRDVTNTTLVYNKKSITEKKK